MSNFSRFAIAAVLVAGGTGVAQAQSHSRQMSAGPDQYYALYSDNAGTDRATGVSGTVPPSMSQTVMGLRVPR